MNGILIRIVADTNALFMSIYDETSKAGNILKAASENKIELFAPISVKEELKRVIKKEFNWWDDNKIKFVIGALPVKWIEREIYQDALEKTTVKHKADKPVEALALILNCGILTADKHFDNVKQKIDINNLLAKLEES